MSNSITDDIYSQLQGAPMQQMAQQLGIGQTQMAGAISAALPLLIGALGRNASQPSGAEALLGALGRDHASSGGNIAGLIGSVLGGGAPTRQTDGAGMLGHIFGARQSTASNAVGQTTGLGQDKANMLLRWLAPVVMAYLAKQMYERRQGAAQPTADELGQVLGEETRQVQQQGGLGSILGSVLDQDGDGQLGLGDLLKAGMGALGGRR
ncbi:MAG: DUF937 domain-containing protein [Pseudoxanthomonas suwonensis]|nr:DUF937 domain-containing protein [Pseudoxanthomonas suwonensis]